MNKSTGNMYGFVDHTWNPVTGRCPHGCSYCYMKRFPLGKLRLNRKVLKENFGDDKNIFVCSGTDLFCQDVPNEWIQEVLDRVRCNMNIRFLLQTKNPYRMLLFKIPKNAILCTTIETNRIYPEMGDTDNPELRASALKSLSVEYDTMVTIEPVMDFDLEEMVRIVSMCNPVQVNIGADSKGSGLSEPGREKILDLISRLNPVTKVFQKENLGRLL